jgi:predicted short-subunit dehydrogenase-like oxidoreductase (DUF2520 family)
MKVIVLGRGKVGSALARRLSERGSAVSLRSARHASWRKGAARDGARKSRAGTIWLLAVADYAIADVARQLAAEVSPRDVVLHCAGARDASELSACRDAGAATGVLHPLVSFASKRATPDFAGCTFVVTGAPRALRAARLLCRQLDAVCLVAPVMGPAYHAAAALLANGSAALAYSAQRILSELGIEQRAAERALAGLLATVASNVGTVGVPQALTGPVARGDADTVRAHLRALSQLSSQLAAPYRQVQPIIEACAASLRVEVPAEKAARPGAAKKKRTQRQR